MKRQQLFIRQLIILLLLGTSVICTLVFSKSNLLKKELSIVENGIELTWNGSTLLANHQNHGEQETNDINLIPPNVGPLFFKPIPINNADTELLLTIPGVGPSLAKEINVTKKRLGGYKKYEELLLVKGIGRKKMNTLKDYFSFQ